ncbi:hypothetical protein INT44_002675, partial [Umbelopsis vinacea]
SHLTPLIFLPAILFARTNEEWRRIFLPELQPSTMSIQLDPDHSSYEHFKALVEFMYLGHLETVKHLVGVAFRNDVIEFTRLELPGLEKSHESSDSQFKRHIETMGRDGVGSDIDIVVDQVHFPAHKFMLSVASPYFNAMFSGEFVEAAAAHIRLPSNVFSPDCLNAILRYIYTGEIAAFESNTTCPTEQVAPLPIHSISLNHLPPSLVAKQQSLYQLQRIWIGADYLGMTDTLCAQVLRNMYGILHNLDCACQDCQSLIPQNLMFAHKNSIHALENALLKGLLSDPEKSVPTIWAHRHFAREITDTEMRQRLVAYTVARVHRHNAIQILYACFSASKTLTVKDPFIAWSPPSHSLISSVTSYATRHIAEHFLFFCTEYPTLLSCVDGITYTLDFLEFLLQRLLEDEMEDTNAGILYQGIVLHLMCREGVQRNLNARSILNVARDMTVKYIERRLPEVKNSGSLNALDSTVLVALAEDLSVPYRTLSRSHSSDKPPNGFFSGRRRSSSSSRSSLNQSSILVVRSTLSRSLDNQGLTTSQRISNAFNMRGWTRRGSAGSVASSAGSVSMESAASFPTSGPSSPVLVPLPPTNPFDINSAGSSDVSIGPLTPPASPPLPCSNTATRASRLKFVLPPKLAHQSSYSNGTYQGHALRLGMRVKLLRRTDDTVGTIRFIGEVDFADGTWVGVELDRRVGKNDGSVDEMRYFQTTANRGVFVKSEDLAVAL